MNDTQLHIMSVSMSYPGSDDGPRIELFRRLSISALPGMITAVSGRSGSGKTTLLNIAAGLTMPVEGSVSWGSHVIGELTEDDRRSLRGETVGVVLQGGGLISSLTAAENVAIPGLPDGVSRDGTARALDLLDRFGIRPRARHYPFQLSGGEQQRVGVARALFRGPPILLVDEPTANLDRRAAGSMIALLRGLADEGHTILVASHDAHLLEASNQVVSME